MDRVDFAKSMNTDKSIISIVKMHFDETMVAYDLVGRFNISAIDSTFDNGSASFNVEFDSEANAEFVCGKVNNSMITKYNRNFSCEAQHSNNTLSITIKD